jgi:methylaspartate ammonia-lyase
MQDQPGGDQQVAGGGASRGGVPQEPAGHQLRVVRHLAEEAVYSPGDEGDAGRICGGGEDAGEDREVGGSPTRIEGVDKEPRGSSAPSASSGTKRKMRDLEVELAPVTKKMKTAAMPMSQVDFYGALVRIMETSKRRMAESSRAAERREEEFGRALRSMAVAVEQQNKILARIETRLTAENWKGKGRARSEDNLTDEVAEETRDVGEAAEAQTVPIIDASTPADSRDEVGEDEDDDEDEE